jgi:hypothetical protein
MLVYLGKGVALVEQVQELGDDLRIEHKNSQSIDARFARSPYGSIDETPLGGGRHLAASARVELGVVEDAGLLQHGSLLDAEERRVVLCSADKQPSGQ